MTDSTTESAPSEAEGPQDVLTVSDLTDAVKRSLEARWAGIWVDGEIRNLARPRSGHLYMSLTDEGATLRAVMFRHAAARAAIRPEEGQRVLAFGTLTVYAPRGDYQLRVTRLLPRGQGALQKAFEELRARLEAEGLFDPARKRPLPPHPRRVGVVTSPTGAAVHDILRVLRRRNDRVDVVLSPTRVQGAGSANEVAAALDRIQEVEGLDLVIVGRGGGSLEDLWAFNEEPVARAIFRSRIPVVSAVGHEVDVTIADMVADVRAATPSAAAELVVPVRADLVRQVDGLRRRLARSAHARLNRARDRVRRLLRARVYRDPMALLDARAQRVDELAARLASATRRRLDAARRAAEGAEARLRAVGPQRVLERGFAVLTREGDPTPLRSRQGLEVGDRLEARLADGRVPCEVVGPGRRKARGARKQRANDPSQRTLFEEGSP